jgi:hypothetical protein
MAIWQSFSRRFGSDDRKRRKSSPSNSLRQKSKRPLGLEPFEERILLAIDGPRLLAAIPATGVVINDNTVLTQAPREILLRFDSAIDPNTLPNYVASIRFVRSVDDVFGNANDVTVTPNYIGIETSANEVIVRFDQNLPDDLYRMTIVGSGVGALKDTSGKSFNNSTDLVRPFSLDLAPQVVAVVPQPISRDGAGKLTQATNQIDVYFNANDTLDMASATNVNNYQLIRTGGTSGTATPNDDVVFKPISVSYSPTSGKAVLTFNTSDLLTSGTYRLRVGTSEPVATSITALTNPPTLENTSLGKAVALGPGGNPFGANLGTQTVSLTDVINSVSTTVLWPGSPLEPGERPVGTEAHVMGGSNNSGIGVIEYNFKSIYGQLFEQDQLNLITPAQKDRIREVMAYYSYYLGVEFVETASSGWTIALGDPRVLGATPNVGGVAGGNLAIMNYTNDWGASEARGGFFITSMHEIGHLLGLGHNYEAPAVQGGGIQDGVYPGDFDILYGRYLWPALGNDINVYRFNLTSAGRLNVETIAERLQALGLGGAAGQLDSVITLYDATGKIVARNDDYYGKDSFLQLDLNAGTYYVAITSTGNTNFDPTVINSGAGGTTAGGYQLRMTFTPTPGADVSIRDTSGNRLDGDYDGAAGGANNFWFKVGNTIYVDKVATGGTGALGSITNPYTRISDALAVATPNSVVRIVGNGGADNNLATLADNQAYNIGFDSINTALSDGTKFDVPKGVTVMIDAGAIIKLRGANVNAGSFDVNIDRSTGALQVLGTTATNATGDIGSVHFTSYYNSAIGAPGANSQGLAKGNWGGIVFRNDSDLEANGVFLNSVNQARISYGGGSVSVSGDPSVFRPIHMATARPTVTFNTITNSADAAMSATPNSFEESEFLGPGFQAEYTRVGPKVYGNSLTQNSINGLFISVQTSSSTGQVLDELTVNGRIANTDIVHVLTETLLINGNAGGLINVNGTVQARPAGRLAIDPGTIVKLGGGRFETEIGAQLIAEGTLDRPIIFTSLYDDRYGASGSSDTTNNSLVRTPTPGEWGGFMFGPTSTGSIDYALIAFAGGELRFEGFPDNMNPVEIHQATVRITNSTFAYNRLPGGGDRSGRGAADAAVIFISGAQPVILNNIFQTNTGGSVISINVNALNATLLDDWGRSRGGLGLAGSYPKNTGPLIRNNLIGDNSVNGMVVRGGLITTNVIWDDTDIVHVVNSTISLRNQQSLSGTLRLQSSPSESLVVKLLGTNTDIIAGGELLDIDDRTGGTLQIVGTPGHAVVLTSLKDDTVGAGLTPQGLPQKDTLNRKGVVAPAIADSATTGPVILDTAARDVHGSSWNFRDGWDSLVRELRYIHENSRVVNKPNSILVVGWETDEDLGVPYSAEAIKWAAQQLGLQITFADTRTEIASGVANAVNGAYSLIYVPSHSAFPLPDFVDDPYINTKWWGGVEKFMLDTLNANKANLFEYLNNRGGGMLVMAQDSAASPYQFAVPGDGAPYIMRNVGGNSMTATEAIAAGFDAAGFTDTYLNEGAPYRATFEGSVNFNRLTPWGVDPITGEVAMLGRAAGGQPIGAARDIVSPGDWGTIRLDVLSNDRNVDAINEVEQGFTSTGDTNQAPSTSQSLGELAKDLLSGDDNVRLGFEIYGGLSQATSSPGGGDVDVYSFRGTAGTTVWLDIDRTSTSLDSVIELVDANGAVIARSDNSIAESAGTEALVGSAKPMRPGTETASVYSQPDFYTTNEKDAGMRVRLPGTVGNVGTYYVRVRSSSTNLNNLTGGLTKGNYVVQVRLQEKDEFAGSTVRYADVRYANNGIEVIGKPEQSALVSNTAQTGLGNSSFFSAQDLGNLLESGTNTIDVAGNLQDEADVHWYKFSLNYEQIQSIKGLNDGLRTFAAMLQVNYADGLGRPDTTMSLYDSEGTLLMIARDGQIADSLPRPNVGGIGTDTANLKHGSFGSLDPTIGPVHLPAGAPKLYDSNGNVIPDSVITYYVAISSNATLPEALTATFAAGTSNPLIRLEPTDSITRIVDDRVGFSGGGITTAGGAGSLFPVSSNPPADLNSYADAYHLGDVVLFVNTQTNQGSRLATVNPFTGEEMTDGSLDLPDGTGAEGYQNIAMRNDGRLYALTYGSDNDSSGNYVEFNTANGQVVSVADDKMQAYNSTTKMAPLTLQQSDYGIQYEAFTYFQSPDSTTRRLFAIGRRHVDNDPNVTGQSPEISKFNMLFELNPDTGEVLNLVPANLGSQAYSPLTGRSGTDRVPLGIITTTASSQLVGMTFVGNNLFAIAEDGRLYQLTGGRLPTYSGGLDEVGGNFVAQVVPVSGKFTSLVAGPQNVEGGKYKNTLFAIDDSGRLYAFDTGGVARGVFLDGASVMSTGIAGAEGLTFSSLDYNLWHATTDRKFDEGHGINPTFNDNTARSDNVSVLSGGGSFYFGLSARPGNNDPELSQPGAAAYASNSALLNTYALPGGAYGTLTSKTFDLAGYNALDKPTLYFNYLLETQGFNSNDVMTDAFRVFASLDGATWELLATNNVVLGDSASENPEDITPSGGNYKGQSAKQKVQGLYDNTPSPSVPTDTAWRQARVDLGDYAGDSGIRLRFQFSTAGTMGSGDSQHGTGRVLKALPGAQLSEGQLFSIDGQDFIFRKGVPATLNNEIAITANMTSTQVAAAIATAMDKVFILGLGNVDDPTIFSSVKVVGDELRLFGHTITSAGPLPSNSVQLTGDGNGDFESRSRDRSGSTLEGVYVDDFIIGFASRGELVTGAQSLDENFLATEFATVPELEDENQILTGTYQLQIRPAQEFGVVLEKPDAGELLLTKTFNVNDRFAQGITLVAKAGSLITDGQAFIIDDGSQELKFEFNKVGGQTIAGSILIPVSDSDSAATVAIKISNAINLAVTANGFKVRAATVLNNGPRVDLFDALSVAAQAVVGNGLASILTFNTVGDTRPQFGSTAPGQTIIQNSIVTHSRQVGIQVIPVIGQIEETGASFGTQGQHLVGVPGRSGSIANLPSSNNRGWVPGVTIKNNLVTHSGRTGIMVGGDPNASWAYAQGLSELGWGDTPGSASGSRDVELFLPFVRVVNNTVYDAKVGIAAANASSPTIMNNIVANVRIQVGGAIQFQGAAIYIDPSSGAPRSSTSKYGDSVVIANLYQNNSLNVAGSGDALSITVPVDVPLFVNAAQDNFYLVASSVAIDSSVDSLLDRAQLTNVLIPLGIPPSAILAPEIDLFGQKRIDDPAVDPPAGVGGNVFKDRGALERGDFSGPTARLVGPVDNSTDDRNSLPNQVTLLNSLVTEFAIQLLDNGVGIDDSTVDVSKFVIQRTIGSVTETLTPNFDYILSYDTNAGVVRLLPAQGLWINGIYTVTLSNANGNNPIKDLAGNSLQANAPPDTRFVIELTDKIVSPWQNPNNPYDVNNSGSVTGADLLILINRILTVGTGQLPIVATVPPYYDVTGDGALRTSDLLAVVNYILTHPTNSAAPLTAVAATESNDPPAAEPLVAEPAAAEPLVADSLSSSDIVAAGLTMSEKSVDEQPTANAAAAVTSQSVATSPRAVDKAIYADAPLDDAVVNGVDRWDEDLDSILTDLSGDLRVRTSV